MLHDSPTLTEHERQLAEAVAARRRHPQEACELIGQVAFIFSATVEEILGRKRTTRMVDARTIVACALHERGWSYVEIGDAIERDAATVNNLIRRMAYDFELRRLSKELAAA